MIGLLLGLILVLASGVVATGWIKADKIPVGDVKLAVEVMGLVLALQWPSTLYGGTLQGLQRQVLLNIINAGILAVRSFGAILVLYVISNDIRSFFIWQMLVAIAGTSVMSIAVKRSMPDSAKKPCFRYELLQGVWRFSAGMFGTSVTGIFLSQLDKVVLSKMLSLKMFGYYALVSSVAAGFYKIAGPFTIALFPKFTQLHCSNDEDALCSLYHKSCQTLAVAVIPLSVTVCLFPYEVIYLWTGNHQIALNVMTPFRYLVAGTALSCLMTIPGILQGSSGWTSLGLAANLVGVVVMTPITIVIAAHYGGTGTAAAWFCFNAVYFLVLPHFIHRRLLKHSKWFWFSRDVFFPLSAGLFVVTVSRLLCHEFTSDGAMALYLTAVFALTSLASAFAAPEPRAWLVRMASSVITKQCNVC